jgi:glycosyltransferase involved in cell wall biosynthesis
MTKFKLPVTVIMLTLNEGHNLERVAKNLKGKIDEVIVLDSYSVDDTVDICLKYKFKVYQRKFDGFGNQWTAALNITVSNPWVMKLDPDEFISDELFSSIDKALKSNIYDGFYLKRQLTFLGEPLNVYDRVLRIWRTGKCRFTSDSVNEYPIVSGKCQNIDGILFHFDSPNLEHWFEKQNKYSSKEGIERIHNSVKFFDSEIFRSSLRFRKWIKKYFWHLPLKFNLLFIYLFIFQGAFKSKYNGFLWVKSRIIVYKLYELKYLEARKNKYQSYPHVYSGSGIPDPRCPSI